MATIAENLQTIQTIKNNIKTSIENKGVSVGDVSFTEYSTKIDEITTGGSGGEIDFSLIGYNTNEENNVNTQIQSDILYSKQILDNWDNTLTNANNYFNRHNKLIYCPKINTSNILNMRNMFYECYSLISVPELDTSNVTNMSYMFYSCYSLSTLFPMNTTRVIDMSCMFQNCYNLKNIPTIDTSNVENVEAVFQNCKSLQSIPLLDFGNVTNINYVFGYSNFTNLTDLGGFKNLKINWNDSYGLYGLPNLTYESVMNVINNLYDFRGNGDTTTTRTIQFNSKSKALLNDADIAIATNKGWVIS